MIATGNHCNFRFAAGSTMLRMTPTERIVPRNDNIVGIGGVNAPPNQKEVSAYLHLFGKMIEYKKRYKDGANEKSNFI